MLRTGKQGLKDIYVVGCGPSLKKFDWWWLADKTTIAVNGSLIDVPNPDYFVTADSGFACIASRAHFWDVQTYKILVMRRDHFRWRRVEQFISYWDHRISPVRFDGEIGFSESEFSTGQNSGFCGMQLAAILGAERIHLLGMDFCGQENPNYHNRYPSNPKKWNEFLIHFETAAKILDRHGVKVISHSPTSRLNDTVEYQEIANGE